MADDCSANDTKEEVLYSISQLVRLCAQAFDSRDESIEDETFISAFIHVHEWIIDSAELMAQFIALFQESSMNADIDVELGICHAINYWIQKCPTHFDASCKPLVEHIRRLALKDQLPSTSLPDLSTIPSYAWLRNVSVRNPVSRQVSLSFEQWSAADISTSLSHIDYKALFRIPIGELRRYCREGNLSNTPILERSISIFNSLTNWVQSMILNRATPAERAEIITKFVNVAKHLRKLNNFNTLMAVIGGVTHSNIARLSKTSSALSADIKRELVTFTQLLSTQSNFACYRRALSETSDSFRIPIMGVHLKDLIAIQVRDGCMDRSCMVTREKILNLAHLLSFFVCFNRTPHNFPDASIDLINTLKVSLDIRYNEDDIYQLSLKREPRTLLNFQGTAKSVVFADWASGVSSALDSETVNKHVSAMVDAVFKHYDHDKDGCISRLEFQQIVGNFPFIDSFGSIDSDRDGQISKSEMKAYFIEANKRSMEFRQGFKHNFHETTFLTPTSCAHCGKLLWGLIRQGFKCKDCGLSVHGYCKDSVVVECRRQPSGVMNWWYPTGNSYKNVKKSTINTRSKDRLRTVSTTSENESPEGRAECSTSNTCSTSFILLRPHSAKSRARSETTDCYRSRYRCRSPADSPDGDLVPSLASEEVFEDESSYVSISELNPVDTPVR